MTDNEIIKALECCISDRVSCKKCPLYGDGSPNCWEAIRKNALELINRQKAEVERLKSDNDILSKNMHNLCKELDAEKLKNF